MVGTSNLGSWNGHWLFFEIYPKGVNMQKDTENRMGFRLKIIDISGGFSTFVLVCLQEVNQYNCDLAMKKHLWHRGFTHETWWVEPSDT